MAQQKAIVLPVATANYVSVFKPKPPPNAKPEDEKNYTITLTYKKGSREAAEVMKLLPTAAAALANAKWPGKGEAVVKSMRYPVVADGDERLSPTSGEPMFPGELFVVAKRKESFGRPGVVDKSGQDIIEASKLYAGAQVRVQVTLFPFNHPQGGRGIGVGLANLMLVGDGQRRDNRESAQDAFADYVEEPSASDENPDSML